MSTPFASGCPLASRIASRLCAQVRGSCRDFGPDSALRAVPLLSDSTGDCKEVSSKYLSSAIGPLQIIRTGL